MKKTPGVKKKVWLVTINRIYFDNPPTAYYWAHVPHYPCQISRMKNRQPVVRRDGTIGPWTEEEANRHPCRYRPFNFRTYRELIQVVRRVLGKDAFLKIRRSSWEKEPYA